MRRRRRVSAQLPAHGRYFRRESPRFRGRRPQQIPLPLRRGNAGDAVAGDVHMKGAYESYARSCARSHEGLRTYMVHTSSRKSRARPPGYGCGRAVELYGLVQPAAVVIETSCPAYPALPTGSPGWRPRRGHMPLRPRTGRPQSAAEVRSRSGPAVSRAGRYPNSWYSVGSWSRTTNIRISSEQLRYAVVCRAGGAASIRDCPRTASMIFAGPRRRRGQGHIGTERHLAFPQAGPAPCLPAIPRASIRSAIPAFPSSDFHHASPYSPVTPGSLFRA